LGPGALPVEGSLPLGCRGKDRDGGGETEHATCPRDFEISIFGGAWPQGDLVSGGGSALDGARDAAACGGGRTFLAAWRGGQRRVLEAALYKAAGTKTGHRRAPEPDWAEVHRELKRKHVTLQVLWDEYIERHPTMTPSVSMPLVSVRIWTAPLIQ
jgi:hypothetical protein